MANPMHFSLVTDAQRRSVPDDGHVGSDLNQLLPTTDARLPTVGQHTFGNYANYSPASSLPDWRQKRAPRATASAMNDEQRASQPQVEQQWSTGVANASNAAHTALRTDGTATGYRLTPVAIAQPSGVNSARIAANRQIQRSALAPQRPATPTRVGINNINGINMGVQVDRAPSEYATRSSHKIQRTDSLTEPMNRLSIGAPAPPSRPTSIESVPEVELPPTTSEITSQAPKEKQPPFENEKVNSKIQKVEEVVENKNVEEAEEEEPEPEACSSSIAPNETSSTGDSGCVADFLSSINISTLQNVRAGQALDSKTIELILSQRRVIMEFIANGTVDKTIFSEVDADGDRFATLCFSCRFFHPISGLSCSYIS